MIGDVHPALPLLLGALLVPFSRRSARLLGLLGLLAPPLSLFSLLAHSGASELELPLLNETIHLVRIDALSRVFAIAFILFSFVANVFAWSAPKRGELSFGLLLAAAGVAVVVAGDWVSLFFGWEGLSVASVALIWSGGTRGAQRAGLRYAIVHVAGGVCLLAGIVLQSPAGSALEGAGAWLILAGFAVNAAIPPLHAWLPDAYPRASIYGSVWLTAFTTKAAVYALARWFPGNDVLAWAGAAMAIYGVVFALMENDLRRLFSYHIVSQVGFMVAGVGVGTELALNGATAHAFCHIFYKGLLMMCAAAIIHATARGKLTELAGFGRRFPLLFILFLTGAVSIAGAPPFSGFISKSMTIAAAASSGASVLEIVLTIASVGTFVSIAAKITHVALAARGELQVESKIPRSMLIAMAIAAALSVGLGAAPELLYAALPFTTDYRPYTLLHISEALQLACVSALGFWLLKTTLASTDTVTRDFDRVYAFTGAAVAASTSFLVLRARAAAGVLGARLALLQARTRALLSAPFTSDAPVAVQVVVLVLVSVGLLVSIVFPP